MCRSSTKIRDGISQTFMFVGALSLLQSFKGATNGFESPQLKHYLATVEGSLPLQPLRIMIIPTKRFSVTCLGNPRLPGDSITKIVEAKATLRHVCKITVTSSECPFGVGTKL